MSNAPQTVQSRTNTCRLPDEVGAVAAERRLFEETRDKRVLFDEVDVLLTQGAAPLDSAAAR